MSSKIVKRIMLVVLIGLLFGARFVRPEHASITLREGSMLAIVVICTVIATKLDDLERFADRNRGLTLRPGDTFYLYAPGRNEGLSVKVDNDGHLVSSGYLREW